MDLKRAFRRLLIGLPSSISLLHLKYGTFVIIHLMSTQSSLQTRPLSASIRSFFINPWSWALISCFLLLVLLSAHTIQDLDLGFHLRSGQWILQNHSFPAKDTFTYTVPDHDYVDGHWLYQVVLYLLFISGSYSLLTLFNVVLIIAVFSFLWARLRLTGTPTWISTLLFAWAIWECEIRFQVRPEIVSWLLMSVMLLALEQRTARKRDFLYLLPILQVVWANMEGLFILGWGLMIVYLVSGIFHQRRADSKLGRFSGLAMVLCLLNPYFFRGILFPFQLWQTLHTKLFHSNINEFMSPWVQYDIPIMPFAQLWGYKLFSFLLLFLILITWKKRKIHEFFLVAIFFYLSANAVRNIPLFILICLPITAACLKDLEWAWLRKITEVILSRSWVALILITLLSGLGLRVITNAYYVDDRRTERFGLGVNDESQPVRATDFLIQNHLDGRILNALNPGGWLDWKGPQKVFIDGRLEVMGENLFAEYISTQYTGKITSLADQNSANILFFNPAMSTSWVSDLQNNNDWRPVYLDENTVIYLKKGYAPQVPALDDSRIMAEYNIQNQVLERATEFIKLPEPTIWDFLLKGFYTRANYPIGISNMGTFFLLENHPQTAEAFFLEALNLSGGKYFDLYYKLGVFYYLAKRYDEARLCLERVLKNDPSNPSAQNILESLPHGGK